MVYVFDFLWVYQPLAVFSRQFQQNTHVYLIQCSHFAPLKPISPENSGKTWEKGYCIEEQFP